MWKTPVVLLSIPAAMVGAWQAPDLTLPAYEDAYLACSGERVSTYGWTHQNKAQAELAAILRWKDATAKQGKAFTDWHNARDRHLSCRQLGQSKQIQCRIAGTPCKPKKI